MNKIFTLSLLTCFYLTSFSQTYQGIPTTNAMWRESATGYQCSCCSDYQIFITGDTVIGSFTYHKLQKTGIKYQEDLLGYCTTNIQNSINQYVGSFRNDTLNKMVYFVPPLTPTETLLYDFNLYIGDTISTYLSSTFGIDWVVSNIDSVNLGGVYRKRFEANNCSPYPLYIIEGIGSTYGFLSPFICPAPYYEYIYNLLCFTNNSTTVYPDSTTVCDIVSSINEFSLDHKPLVFPNPTSGILNIKTELNIYNLSIINSMGQKIYRENNKSGNSQIDITNLKQGIYLIQILENGINHHQIIIRQ